MGSALKALRCASAIGVAASVLCAVNAGVYLAVDMNGPWQEGLVSGALADVAAAAVAPMVLGSLLRELASITGESNDDYGTAD